MNDKWIQGRMEGREYDNFGIYLLSLVNLIEKFLNSYCIRGTSPIIESSIICSAAWSGTQQRKIFALCYWSFVGESRQINGGCNTTKSLSMPWHYCLQKTVGRCRNRRQTCSENQYGAMIKSTLRDAVILFQCLIIGSVQFDVTYADFFR